ncbi:hypothetical protein [Microcystis sp. M42BS1]|uniref:hypothetical protein n=1 Tax=Microcystis sp. M42BS1 TaxID=2771192 RepID=UPI00258381CE|nr:hypothetical protein [Microcystis sp. M42BS1]MCA2570707.1 hypothetical protein [Microcystis sp. M42BS1]
MATIVTRAGKGTPLTFAEMDANLNNLNNDKAELASPVFTGNPRAPTPAPGDNDTSIATTQFVTAAITAAQNSPAFSGNPTAPTPSPGDNDTSIATTAFVQNALGFASAPTGAVMMFTRISAPTGWIKLNGGTIGSAASGATTRANADTQMLYEMLWTEFNNTVLPIQDNLGVATSRGASAAADFAANKRLPIFDGRGEFFRGWDDGRGVDTGRNLATFQAQDIQSHTHNIKQPTGGVAGGISGTPAAAPDVGGNLATSSTGGTETRPRNIAFLVCIKL